jgi:ABC-type branched-subunit amino acid transport system ATPase component
MSPANEVIPHPLLQAQALSKHFGGTAALKDVSFSAAPGEIVGLIGPNGAGKTTLLNLLSGVLRPSAGRVLFKGRDLAGLKAHAVARMGIARTLQTPRSFPSMSVLENVAVGAVFGRPHGHLDHATRCLELVGLGARGGSPMSSLNLQERKSVELARALAMAPSVVLIDEAMSGLNPTEIEESMRLIRRVRDETGVTIIWVEHVVRAVMAVVERVLVLNFGSLIAAGSPAEIARDGAVIEAYLGTAA